MTCWITRRAGQQSKGRSRNEEKMHVVSCCYSITLLFHSYDFFLKFTFLSSDILIYPNVAFPSSCMSSPHPALHHLISVKILLSHLPENLCSTSNVGGDSSEFQ
jgi:hypothetical protein